MKDIIGMYTEYISKTGTRVDPLVVLAKKYRIDKAMYPGSYIHIEPSLVVPELLYVDTDKKAIKFFKQMDIIKEYIDCNKRYKKETKIAFLSTNFYAPIKCKDHYFDLLISLYAGFISQACKRYLKIGGMLFVNDSHGDATFAYMDEDYEFIGVVIYKNGRYIVDVSKNEIYFKMKKNKAIDMEKVKNEMKGPKYAYQTEYYLFKKIK